jgi:hypothetical protein
MRFAYFTNDEVNEDQALQLADECGVTLCCLFPTDAHGDEDFDAVLYDWDSLSAGQHQQVIFECLTGYASCPVAVHGFSLDAEEREALHNDGIAVFRHLDGHIFTTLRRLVRRSAARVLQTVGAGR